MKAWYQSKTVWLLLAQLLIIWSAFVTKESSLTATISVTMTTVAGMIIRFYTDKPVSLNGGKES